LDGNAFALSEDGQNGSAPGLRFWDSMAIERSIITSSAIGCSILSTPLRSAKTLHANLDGDIQQMTFSPETNDLARSLLAYEAASGGTSEPTQAPVVRICERLRGPLCALAGVAGYRSLLARALTLAKAEAPCLGALQVADDASLQGLAEFASQSDKDHASDAGVLLTTQLVGLFLSLLGAALTLQLVQDVFPNLKVTTESGALTPFADILREVGNLNTVSDRLAELANQNPGVEEALLSVSGNVRNTATTLEVVALIKAKSAEPIKKMKKPERERYLN
jgi:hypothetical protein